MEKKRNAYLTRVLGYPSRFKILWHSMGPGIVTGAADDDPSGIGTYTVAGAQFGTAFLWTALITWPLMAAVQMACARIGMVTGEGLAAALRKKIPRPLLFLLCLALFLANTLNVGADLSAMADAAETLEAGSSHVYVIVFGVLIAWATLQLRYHHIARILKWLALLLFAYIATAIIAEPDWREALRDTFIPHWPTTRDEWGLLVAILGTTISPYLFFWQASQEVEEEKSAGRWTLEQRQGATEKQIVTRKYDVGAGTLFSNVVMYFIILSSAVTLHRHGLTHVETSKQAAEALLPIAGRAAYLLYTVALVGVGLLAIPTLTGSAAYALAETFNWHQGLDAKPKEARAFYSVIIVSTVFAIIMDFSDLNPIKALYWSAVVNGLLAPFLLVAIFFIVRDKKLMLGQPSSRGGQILLALAILLMTGAALGLFFV